MTDRADRADQDGTGSNRRYNGWPSYETWLVYTWLTNEASIDEECRAIARAAHPVEATDRPEDVARVAEALRAYVEEESPLIDVASLYADLVVAALGHVVWEAIARHVIADEQR